FCCGIICELIRTIASHYALMRRHPQLGHHPIGGSIPHANELTIV
ncbi:MAG: hypothetical protein ACJAT5_000702, partial [Lentimonas sp.]